MLLSLLASPIIFTPYNYYTKLFIKEISQVQNIFIINWIQTEICLYFERSTNKNVELECFSLLSKFKDKACL